MAETLSYTTINQEKTTAARANGADSAQQHQRAFQEEREQAVQQAQASRITAYNEQIREQEAIIRKQTSTLSELKERERRALAHPGAVEVAPEAFAEEDEKIKHVTGEIEAGKRKVNSLMRCAPCPQDWDLFFFFRCEFRLGRGRGWPGGSKPPCSCLLFGYRGHVGRNFVSEHCIPHTLPTTQKLTGLSTPSGS